MIGLVVSPNKEKGRSFRVAVGGGLKGSWKWGGVGHPVSEIDKKNLGADGVQSRGLGCI